MGGLPGPGGPLSLLDDALDGPVGASQAGDGPKVRPAERGLVGLLECRADEQPVLAQLAGQVGEPPLDRTVQVALRGEVLATRDDLLRAHRRQRRPSRLEVFSIGALHPLRPLQVHKMLQRRLAKGEQPKLHAGRVAPGLVWHVGPAHIRSRPDGREQVLHHRPVQHLLPGDGEDHLTPALHRIQLISAKTGTWRALETERGVQVLTHQGVLKLSRLAQQVGQLLAVPHHDRGLSPHRRNVSPAMIALNDADTGDASGRWPR